MIAVGRFFELRLSATKEEGQPKLATLSAFDCEPERSVPSERFSHWATVSPFLTADVTFQVK
jgi:hypothetical protein